MKLKFCIMCGLLCVCLVGCGKKPNSAAFDNISANTSVSQDVSSAQVGSSGSDRVSSISSASEIQPLEEGEQGVVSMDELDASLAETSAEYASYDVGSDEGIERAEDGSIAFHVGDVSFIYRQDIDIQLVTEEDSNVIYVKGLDNIGSSMQIGVYSGGEYEDKFYEVQAQDHLHYDINGNPYWGAQSQDNHTWYYAYLDVLEPKIVIVNVNGDFRQRYMDVCLPVPERYDVSRE